MQATTWQNGKEDDWFLVMYLKYVTTAVKRLFTMVGAILNCQKCTAVMAVADIEIYFM